MIPARLPIALFRLVRLALSEWAREADADDRPCCALTIARVRGELIAPLIEYLTHQCLKE